MLSGRRPPSLNVTGVTAATRGRHLAMSEIGIPEEPGEGFADGQIVRHCSEVSREDPRVPLQPRSPTQHVDERGTQRAD